MPFCAVLSLLLLFIAALGQSWFWRVGQPGLAWYGGAAFYWGVFFLALYLEWPTLKALGM
jgi:hypothetical protein